MVGTGNLLADLPRLKKACKTLINVFQFLLKISDNFVPSNSIPKRDLEVGLIEIRLILAQVHCCETSESNLELSVSLAYSAYWVYFVKINICFKYLLTVLL
jgi:hypothetical protein